MALRLVAFGLIIGYYLEIHLYRGTVLELQSYKVYNHSNRKLKPKKTTMLSMVVLLNKQCCIIS
jgi:hypothetical protein